MNSIIRTIVAVALLGGAVLVASLILDDERLSRVGLWILLLVPVARNVAVAITMKDARTRVLALVVSLGLLAIYGGFR